MSEPSPDPKPQSEAVGFCEECGSNSGRFTDEQRAAIVVSERLPHRKPYPGRCLACKKPLFTYLGPLEMPHCG